MKYEFATGCRGVHVFLQALEADTFIAEIGDCSDKMLESAARAGPNATRLRYHLPSVGS